MHKSTLQEKKLLLINERNESTRLKRKKPVYLILFLINLITYM